MTAAVISDYIDPSEEIQGPDGEITTDNLLDEVSLYNLYDEGESPEKDAERILDITYPTDTLVDIIQNTTRKLNTTESLADGGHIIGGSFGTGKSHIELVVYHLLNSPELGRKWIDRHGLGIELPKNTDAAALQMLNLEKGYKRLWEAVGAYLGIEEWETSDEVPKVHAIRDALTGPTAIMIDEFERWFNMATRDDYTADNLAFLQNLLEAAGRKDTPLVVFVSLLHEEDRVESIVQRTNPFAYDLSSRRDEKINFLLHRLIGPDPDEEGIATLAKEYTDVYRQNDQIQLEDYHDMQERIADQYPFHPLLLRLLMEKFSEQRSHQDARGLLDFLTNLLKDNYHEVDLILTGNVDVFGYIDRFRFIDNELVGKYSNDYHRLQKSDETFDEYIEELLNIVLLHSLGRAGEEGANKRQILTGLLRKGGNAHRIIQTFTEEVYGHAWHVHRINGEYTFDVQENPAARIEKKAEDIHQHDAIHRVESLLKDDLFEGHNNVYILDPVNTERDIPDNKSLKIVVSLGAKQSYDEDFEELTTGQEREYNNTIVFVTPEKRSGVNSNTGIIELARKVVAGEQLSREESVLPEGFDEIHDQNYQNLRDRVRDKYGTIHTSTERGLFPQELPTSGNTDFYSATIEAVKPDSSQIRSEVKEAVKEAGASGIRYEHLRNNFYFDLSYTTLTSEEDLEDAINSLCRDGILKVGSYFEQRVGSLGNETTLVHEKFLEPEDDDEGEEDTITIDTAGGSGSGSSGPTSGDGGTEADTSGADGGASGGSSTTVLECPQCGQELDGTSCACGFEFDATDVREGKVSVQGISTDEMLDIFGIEEPEGPRIQSHPIMGTLEADNKPDLVDTLEREVGMEWEVHEITISVDGKLNSDELEEYGITADALDGRVTLDETFVIDPDDPMSKDSLLSLAWSLDVPEKASLAISMQVNKNE